MTRTSIMALCLWEAARVVDLYGPGVHELEHVAEADGPLVWEVAREVAAELRGHAQALVDVEPVQLELFAEVRR